MREVWSFLWLGKCSWFTCVPTECSVPCMLLGNYIQQESSRGLWWLASTTLAPPCQPRPALLFYCTDEETEAQHCKMLTGVSSNRQNCHKPIVLWLQSLFHSRPCPGGRASACFSGHVVPICVPRHQSSWAPFTTRTQPGCHRPGSHSVSSHPSPGGPLCLEV